jgi:hypothetical protein
MAFTNLNLLNKIGLRASRHRRARSVVQRLRCSNNGTFQKENRAPIDSKYV